MHSRRTSRQQPVAQETWVSFRTRKTWYLRRDRGSTSRRMVPTRVGKGPVDSCRLPSGLRNWKPTIPARGFSFSKRFAKARTPSRKPSLTVMSGFKRRNQLPRLRRQASLTPRAKPRFLPQRRKDISRRRRNQAEMGLLGERLSTITTSAPPATMQFDRASCRTKSAVSPHW